MLNIACIEMLSFLDRSVHQCCRARGLSLVLPALRLWHVFIALRVGGAELLCNAASVCILTLAMTALSTVLDSVSSLPHLFPQSEEILFPIMQAMCTEEGQDVFEEILEIISYFTYFSPEVNCKDSFLPLTSS